MLIELSASRGAADGDAAAHWLWGPLLHQGNQEAGLLAQEAQEATGTVSTRLSMGVGHVALVLGQTILCLAVLTASLLCPLQVRELC